MTSKNVRKKTQISQKIFDRVQELSENKSVNQALRYGLFFLAQRLENEGSKVVLANGSGSVIDSNDTVDFVATFDSKSASVFDSIVQLLPHIKHSSIFEFAFREYLNAIEDGSFEPHIFRNSSLKSFEDGFYLKSIPITEDQYKIIVSRYSKNEYGAVLRAALNFFVKGYHKSHSWAEPSSVTESDRNFFDPSTTLGRKHLEKATVVRAYFYKKDQLNFDLMNKNFKLPVNNAVRVCLDRFLFLPGWSKRSLDKPKGSRAISPTEKSKQIGIIIDENLLKELQENSVTGKPQDIARLAIEQYLETSSHALEMNPNPNYVKPLTEKSSFSVKRFGFHLPESQFNKLTIAATWENCTKVFLLNTIFQDYLKSLQP